MANISAVLQADMPSGTAQIVCFIPATDINGQTIDQDFWVDEALTILGNRFRGATAFPPGKGVWRHDERGGELLFEPTVMVLSYADPSDLTEESLLRLRSFLIRMGREAKQGEVGLVIDGTYYGFTHFAETSEDEHGGRCNDVP